MLTARAPKGCRIRIRVQLLFFLTSYFRAQSSICAKTTMPNIQLFFIATLLVVTQSMAGPTNSILRMLSEEENQYPTDEMPPADYLEDDEWVDETQMNIDGEADEEGQPRNPFRCSRWKITGIKHITKWKYIQYGKLVCCRRRSGKPGLPIMVKGPVKDPVNEFMNEDQVMDDEADEEQIQPHKGFRCSQWKVNSGKWVSKNKFVHYGKRVCRRRRPGKPPSVKGAKGPPN